MSDTPPTSADKLAALRKIMVQHQIQAYILSHTDPYRNEYVPSAYRRLEWLTGFSGSAGLCLVSLEHAAVFVDGRYTLQAEEELDAACFAQYPLTPAAYSSWLLTHCPVQARVGYDPWLLTPHEVIEWEKKLETLSGHLIPLTDNIIDSIWIDRPPLNKTPLFLHETWAGETAVKKIERLRQNWLRDSCALLITDPHEVAWLFNIRGWDIVYTPILLAYALIPQHDLPILYLHENPMRAKDRLVIETYLRLSDISQLPADLEYYATRSEQPILCDQRTFPAALFHPLGAKTYRPLSPSPVTSMKAIKNKVEIEGMRRAHVYDGIACCQFLSWLSKTISSAPLTELMAATALEACRRQQEHFYRPSFSTISASNAHAALPHYQVTASSNAYLTEGLYLVDSGGQYAEGTTDVTRTIAIQHPTAEMKEFFTRVLKGHIAIARLIFPAGTTGQRLDAFARQSLWSIGADFAHGTGHGVGSFLSVHEGPHGLSPLSTPPLEAGMIVSNEPGYYRAGSFGIRIENLMLITEYTPVQRADSTAMLCFQTLTLVPIDRHLIALPLLTPEEIVWLNDYHARVWQEIGPKLNRYDQAWLKEATAPLFVAS